MKTIEQLRRDRCRLFDENYICKTKNRQEVINFCNELKEITNIQTCGYDGSRYEYFPQVCRSALYYDEMQSMW